MKQPRTFILTNEPSLKYYKNETELKVFTLLTYIQGEIQISRQVYARRSGRDRFEIVTPGRVYFLQETQAGDSDEWITQINNVIAKYCDDK